MLNYNKLCYFYTVGKTLNLSKAAQELHISQSAVSRHMRELESDLGVPLFRRTNRGLILTEAGRVLLNEISFFYSHEHDLIKKVRSAAFPEWNELHIGFMGIGPAFQLPIIINELLRDHPGLKIGLKRFNWDEIEPALEADDIDVALCLRMGRFDSDSFDHRILDQGPPLMVVPQSHPLAAKDQASLQDFVDDHFLILSELDSTLPYSYTNTLFQKEGFRPKEISLYDQVETILMLIHANAGVSLLSKFAATDQFSDLKTVDIGIQEPMILELVWKKGKETPIIRELSDLLMNTLR